MQVSTRSPTDQRITDAARLAPYLTHVIRQHGQLALMPQETTSRSRKPRREKRPRQERQQRPPEEPRFNVGAPITPRRIQPGSPGARSRPNRRPDVSDAGSIPDYPPPSFDEAVAAAAAAAARNAPPLSPTDSTTTHSSFADSYQSAPILIPPLPRSQNQPVVTHALPDPESSESLRYSTQAEYDDSGSDEDLEVISTSEATSSIGTWEQDSHIRVFPERAHLEVGTAPTSARTVRSSPSQLTLTPHLSESPQDDRDDITAYSPSTDSQGDDHTVEPHNSTPSPVPPRRRLHLLSGLLKSRDHPASVPSTPTHAAASQLSLPIHFLNRPGSPSKSNRGEGLISRKLFGHKGKDRNTEPQIGGPPEPLDTWDMLSDVERETPPASGSGYPMPPVSPASEHFPSTPRHSESPGLRREGTRPKHHSMLNHPVPPPTSPLTPTTTQRPNTHMDLRAAAVLASLQRQPTMFAVSATASASAAVPSPSSPSQRLPVQSTQVPLQPHTATDSPTRGRSLRATASMIWSPRKHYSPVPSPTRSTTTPTSPSSASLQSGVTNVDYDAVTPATLVGHDQEAVLGALPSSLVQEEEEENFVTPPGSPVRSLLTLPIPTISSSRHTSPVRHEGRIGVTLRDDGPVPSVSPARSEAHGRTARTPTITPRPSVNALHAFAPPNPSPLANQSFERQALIPPAPPSPTLPRRDTVMSVGDTESLIDLYVQSAGPASTPPIADSVAPAASTDSELDEWMSASSGDPKQYHYPGRPLPHPPGASQSGPVRPVLLDTFLAGNIPGGLPPYEEVELERQGLWRTLPFSSRTKPASNAPSLPPSPLVNQPGPRTPPRGAPPELFTVFDEDASEPSSPGSTYEMPPSTPSSTLREFASDDGNEATSRHYREARHLSVTLPPYHVADRRSPAPAERVSRAGRHAPQDCSYDEVEDGGRAVQREWSAAGTRRGGAPTGDAQWARETQAGAAWRDRGPVCDVRDAVPRP
ncbi:hypothetical protein EDB87DRAFT_1690440 [Lactarius vividus]|nr:hypothetical protein EDB87DRAFT_1690440 [Lactarius vividus]